MQADIDAIAVDDEHRAAAAETFAEGSGDEDDDTRPFVDPVALEALGLILEHSLKVHSTHHFYCWTQGLLQNLIRHELLICVQRRGESGALHADTFSTHGAIQPQLISSLFTQDTALAPAILKAWEENHFQPVLLDIRREASANDGALARELNRIDAHEILIHGMHDAAGKPVSCFIFACRGGTNSQRQLHLAKLVVPGMHAAWMHTQFVRPAALETARTTASGRTLLTQREQDILGWIYRGKSNIEIGLILGLSPFTVKNHVQKILRRLNVVNRAQAVGKALALRIFDGNPPAGAA